MHNEVSLSPRAQGSLGLVPPPLVHPDLRYSVHRVVDVHEEEDVAGGSDAWCQEVCRVVERFCQNE